MAAHVEERWLSGRDGEVAIALRIQPGAKRSAIAGLHGDRIKLAVRALPVDGKADEAVIELLAEVFGVPRRDVALVCDHGSRDKKAVVAAPLQFVRAVIAQALADNG
jgi:uncharacterized protein (TIGR00251 family)